jgi:hypothetical protein
MALTVLCWPDLLDSGVPAYSVVSYLGASAGRCRANSAHIRQSRPDSGLHFQAAVLKSSLDGGSRKGGRHALSSHIMYLSISFRKSTPPQNRQFSVSYSQSKYYADGLAGELTF